VAHGTTVMGQTHATKHEGASGAGWSHGLEPMQVVTVSDARGHQLS
jgi:hypothetical protein